MAHAGTPASVGDIESFITLLRSACSDDEVYARLERLLSLPDEKRRALVQKWVEDLVVQRAPTDFIRAIACLLDDQVAEKAYEVIYRCEHPPQPPRGALWVGGIAAASVAALVSWKLFA
jgi:hypothetical protein